MQMKTAAEAARAARARFHARTLASLAFPETLGISEHEDFVVVTWTETQGVRFKVFLDSEEDFTNARLFRGTSLWDSLVSAAERLAATMSGDSDDGHIQIRLHAEAPAGLSAYVEFRDLRRNVYPDVAERRDRSDCLVLSQLKGDIERLDALIRFSRGEDIR